MKSKTILLVLSLFFFGCGSPGSQGETNPNVEVVVEKKNLDRSSWISSPGGDKIMYTSQDGSFLLFPGKNEQREVKDCNSRLWLDNTNLLCRIWDNPFVLQTDDFAKLPLTKTEASAIPNLDELLQTATAIYKYEGKYTFEPERNSFYLLTTVPQQNYQVITENVDEVLQGYDYKIIPGRAPSRENEYSPNGDYYFINYVLGLTIYDAVTNKEVVGYDYSEQGQLKVGNWAADSSGVYFQPIRGGGMGPMYPGAILKLKIPEAYLETTPETTPAP